jgi:competence protein ComEA
MQTDLEKQGSNSTTANDQSFSSSTQKVNINTATKEELMTLDGVGEATAEKIIVYRQEHGSFSSIEEIKEVSGIGDKKYEAIKESITV